jgi:flagellar hook-associated protein 1
VTGFSALTNAASALAAQSYGMQVTGQNIANADTEGYTRERVNAVATGPAAGVPQLYSTSSHTAGTVMTDGVSRLNDPIIDAHVRTEQGLSGFADTAASTMSSVETFFPEPSDTGLTEQLNTFWNDWSAVANNPGDGAARSALLQQANTVTDTLHSTSASLSGLVSDTQAGLASSVGQLNSTATALGKLNAEISIEHSTGQVDPSLLDQRDLMLGQLASLGGAQSQLQADGSATVVLGGQTLVSGNTVSTVGVDASSNVTVGGTAVTLTGGQAQAQSLALTSTLPGYQSALDGVASTLATEVNAVHTTGYDLSGNAGGAFFTGTSAATITVAITDPSAIAASGTASAGGNLDAGVAQQIGALGASSTGADAAYRALVANIGSASQRATQQSTVQDSVTSSAQAIQASSSGVSYDDEVTNLLTYQRAYQASSRVLTTVDDMLDTLINRTGRVGL